MRKSTLLLFAAAFFAEAVLLSIIGTGTTYVKPPVSETVINHEISVPTPPVYMPADQTAVYHREESTTNDFLVAMSVIYAAISGFILGYVRYF